jgi:hypothetical protein
MVSREDDSALLSGRHNQAADVVRGIKEMRRVGYMLRLQEAWCLWRGLDDTLPGE